MNVLNDVIHILFYCPCNEDLRSTLWEEVCPAALLVDINKMSLRERCEFMLNAFNVKYIQEWKLFYDCTSNFIYYLCSKYKEILNAIDVKRA